MTQTPRRDRAVPSPRFAADLAALQRLRRELSRDKRIIRKPIEADDRSTDAVQKVVDRTVEVTFTLLPDCDAPVSKHRAARRRGRLPKIDRYPELRSVILARPDCLTDAEIEREVEAAFQPAAAPERHLLMVELPDLTPNRRMPGCLQHPPEHLTKIEVIGAETK